MLSFLSWGQYFTFLGIALLFYYLFIAVIYYGNEIQSLIKGKRRPLPAQRPSAAVAPLAAGVMGSIRGGDAYKPAPSLPVREPEPTNAEIKPDAATGNSQATEADDAAFLEEVEDLADRLKAMMERTGIRTNRTELMEKISKELKAFSSVVDLGPFKTGLFSFIPQQASELCDIELEDSDLDAIWQTLHA